MLSDLGKHLREEVIGLNTEVPTLNGSTTYINFDNAATTPPLKTVVKTMNAFLPWYSSIHRGFGYKSQLCTELYDQARSFITRCFGGEPGVFLTIFVKNTTEAINKLSYRFILRGGEAVLSTRMEHHSNDLPWRVKRNTVFAGLTPDGLLDLNDLERKLKKGRIKLVSFCGASNVTGVINPIHTIAEMAHYYGAAAMVDAAQLAPHRPLLLTGAEERVDFMAISGHKIYAPFGTGALIGDSGIFRDGIPENVGGGTVIAVSGENMVFAPPPDREEAGTPNLIGALTLASSLAWLKKNDLAAIAEYEGWLTEYTYQRLQEVPGIIIYGPSPVRHPRVGVITFNLEGFPHGLTASALAHEAGIGVRHGCFCARPYVHHLLGLSPEEINRYEELARRGNKADLPGMVRISFGFYNTPAEVDHLINTLKYLKAEEKTVKKRYRIDPGTGEYSPVTGGFSETLHRHLLQYMD